MIGRLGRQVTILFCLLGCLTASTSRATSSGVEEIFFDRDSEQVLRNCYSVTPERALEIALQPSFATQHSIVMTASPVLDQGRVLIFFQDPGDPTQSKKREIQACPFSWADQSELVQCEIEVQSLPPSEPVSYLTPNYLSVNLGWTRLGIEPLLNCELGEARLIRNAWKQPLRRSLLKTLEYLSERREPWIPSSAIGLIVEGGSRFYHQPWSTQLDLNFSITRLQMEMCDAAVDEISAPENWSHWVGKTWCPWGIEVVRVQCSDGFGLKSPAAKDVVRLDLASPEVVKACSDRY